MNKIDNNDHRLEVIVVIIIAVVILILFKDAISNNIFRHILTFNYR